MTDEQIIKALDKCVCIGESCEECPFYEYTDCNTKLREEFHNLINRQKSELEKKDKLIEIADKMVESLKAEVKRLKAANKQILGNCEWCERNWAKQFVEKKSEAIKDFEERFNSLLADFDDYDTLHIYEIKDRIDIIKEMVGDDNG